MYIYQGETLWKKLLEMTGGSVRESSDDKLSDCRSINVYTHDADKVHGTEYMVQTKYLRVRTRCYDGQDPEHLPELAGKHNISAGYVGFFETPSSHCLVEFEENHIIFQYTEIEYRFIEYYASGPGLQ